MFGKILIDSEITLVPLAEGNVSEVLVKPGDYVQAGRILATLDMNKSDFEHYEKLKILT